MPFTLDDLLNKKNVVTVGKFKVDISLENYYSKIEKKNNRI